MVPDISHRKILYTLDQKNANWRRTINTLKIVDSSVFCNAYTLLISEICNRIQLYLRSSHTYWMAMLKKLHDELLAFEKCKTKNVGKKAKTQEGRKL